MRLEGYSKDSFVRFGSASMQCADKSDFIFRLKYIVLFIIQFPVFIVDKNKDARASVDDKYSNGARKYIHSVVFDEQVFSSIIHEILR